ncbi:MAG: DUF1579 domain-containing protein [Chitinophagaceae bacterium]|nr:DUF1579 domain-containing protein [Chitinophagaceae bacterium]
MKKTFLLLCSAALFFSACNSGGETDKPKTDSGAVPKETGKTEAPAPPMDSAAMMKAWQDFATPGAMHKWMEKTNGTWEAELSNWNAPNTPPTKSKGTNVQSSVMGGRYVIGKFSTTMMGQPMEGMSTMGYDNGKKMFISTWIDNFGTGIIRMTGTFNEATKTLSLKGIQTDPMTGKDMDIREEMTIIDDNAYSLAMYGTGPDGKEMKYMEGTFKKK